MKLMKATRLIKAVPFLCAGGLLSLFLLLPDPIGPARAEAAGEDSPGSRLASLAEDLSRASARGDLVQIGSIHDALEVLEERANGDRELVTRIVYYKAAADFRAGSINRKGGRPLLERCVSSLGNLLSQETGFAEGHVLLAACAGNLISEAPERVIELSMISQRALQLAREIDPDNPRTDFVEGLSILFTPQNFGGGPKAALERFRESVRLFESGPPRDPLISWGHDEALMWLGIALSIDGQQEEALIALRRAAELNPEEQWISQVLIPRVEAGKSLGEIFGIR